MRYRNDRGDEIVWRVDLGALVVCVVLIVGLLVMFGQRDDLSGQTRQECNIIAHDAKVLAQDHKPWVATCHYNPNSSGWGVQIQYERTNP